MVPPATQLACSVYAAPVVNGLPGYSRRRRPQPPGRPSPSRTCAPGAPPPEIAELDGDAAPNNVACIVATPASKSGAEEAKAPAPTEESVNAEDEAVASGELKRKLTECVEEAQSDIFEEGTTVAAPLKRENGSHVDDEAHSDNIEECTTMAAPLEREICSHGDEEATPYDDDEESDHGLDCIVHDLLEDIIDNGISAFSRIDPGPESDELEAFINVGTDDDALGSSWMIEG